MKKTTLITNKLTKYVVESEKKHIIHDSETTLVINYQNDNEITQTILFDKKENKITFYTFKENRSFDMKNTAWTQVVDFISWFDILTSKMKVKY